MSSWLQKEQVTIKNVETQTRKVAKQRATEIVLEAIEKIGVETVGSNTTSVVSLPDDEMKGRIIGKEAEIFAHSKPLQALM